MIFICTGTQVYQFDRLLIEVDRLIESGIIKDDVFAQVGASDYKPKNYKYAKFISTEEFKNIQESASLIISHGGTGALIGASKLGKNIVAVPRLSKYGEHTDDHQIQIVETLEKQGYIRAVYDINELSTVIEQAIANPIKKVYPSKSKIIDIISDYIESF